MMHSRQNRIRMLAFIFLTILGINISQASGKDNSTQTYYAKLIIDVNAFEIITRQLTSFGDNDDLRMDNLQITTKCKSVPDGEHCSCTPNHKWSEEVCQAHQECCDSEMCTFDENSFDSCVSNKAVYMTGSIVLEGAEYHDCLKVDTSPSFKTCNENLLRKMKAEFSTLRGFDTLNIVKYSAGSVIADFNMTIATAINPKFVLRTSKALVESLGASLFLETRGIIEITMPSNPVEYDSEETIICQSPEDLGVSPVWQLKNKRQVARISGGTESTLVSTTKESTLKLTKITEMWEGEYTCAFIRKWDSSLLSHKASAVLDVSLLPNIHITVAPSFPRCTRSDLHNVVVKCAIPKSNETYRVEWRGQDIKSDIIKSVSMSDETITYEAAAIVSCDKSLNLKPSLTCKFINRLNQTRDASIYIQVIYDGDHFCKAEVDWEDTKLNFFAVLPCVNQTGERRRKCKESSSEAVWEPEELFCVNKDVSNVLQNAQIVDIGLGDLEENAANVMSGFKVITDKTETINTFANINASVRVLSSLSDRMTNINNQSTVENLLDSSSNLLNTSLIKSWTSNMDDGNESLASRYLGSVEHLIKITNLTSESKKKTNLEMEAIDCTAESDCIRSVFGVSVSLQASQAGVVKMAGYKELQKYLPNSDEEFEPNSIVVSTTIESVTNVTVKINFTLIKPRPPNVEMKCVAWDNTTNSWSSEGCVWDGASIEGGCTCNHLSAFAILMSRDALTIPWIEEMTYVGLSVSILSLVISLLVELTVWSTLVKTKSLYLRHTAHINISTCLLVADCCFLAGSDPHGISGIWCRVLAVLKHFFYLTVFFWMLVLSSVLLHQAAFPFHKISKRNYLRWSFIVGYGCPFLLVAVTFLSNQAGAEGKYYHGHTCWLIYVGLMEGSIYSFIVPVGIIAFFNVFSMLMVIMKILNQHNTRELQEEKIAAKLVMRTVILLTPIFGITWLFGFATLLIDYTHGDAAYAVNYIFTLLNSFQGLFILLTTCLGDQMVRQALLNCLKKRKSSVSSVSVEMHNSKLKK